MGQKIREDHFSKDLPIYYMKDGWLVEEWKNGMVIKLKKILDK